MKLTAKNSDPKEEQSAFTSNVAKAVAMIALGSGGSYFTAEIKQAVVETKLDHQIKDHNRFEVHVNAELLKIQIATAVVQANQMELAARGQWMDKIDGQIRQLSETMKAFQSNRYTSVDANRDIQHIMREIDRILNELKELKSK